MILATFLLLLATKSTAEPKVLWESENFKSRVVSVAFTPDSKSVVSVASNDSVWVLNTTDGKAAAEWNLKFYSPVCMALSPDGKTVIFGGERKSYGHDLKTMETVNEIEDFASTPTCVAFSADGTKFALGSDEGDLALYGKTKSKPLWQIKKVSSRGVAFSPDSSKIAAVGTATFGFLKMIDAKTGAEIWKAVDAEMAATSVAYGKDGTRLFLATQYGEVKVYSAANGKLLSTWTWDKNEQVQCITLTKDGKTVLAGNGNGSVRAWDAETGKEKWTFRPGEYTIYSIAASPDGKSFAIGGGDFNVRLFELPQ